jgi:hypothetical protein
MQDPEEKTEPGGPVLLEGPEEARALANLAVMLRFHAAQLEQMAGEVRRAPPTQEQKAALWQRMRGLASDFNQTANVLAPWNRERTPAKR